MEFIIVIILQSLHLTCKGMVSSLSDVVYHPDVRLTVVRLVVALVMIVVVVVIAVVVLVVSHCVFPSLSRVLFRNGSAVNLLAGF